MELNAKVYDEIAVRINYAKLFKYLVKDFLTRKDAEQMMSAANLKVSTNVSTVLAGTCSTGHVTGTGQGTGQGQVMAAYKGQAPLGASKQLELVWKAVENAGGVAGQVIK